MDFKHIDLLIKSVAILKEKKPDVMCLIIGDGPEKKGLESMTISLNLKKNVWFLGFLKNHDEVYSYMKSSKVFALPSTREGFGIVALEANACGIPVITVKHKDNGSKDLIEEETNGFICLLDEEEIAKKLTRILKNNLSEKMKKACVDSASKYKWDAIANRIEEVYLK
jgi:glycosyltransferase involved in cell wall biosynthesis